MILLVDLPVDILIQILQKVEHQHLLQKCSLVNKTFLQIIKNPQFPINICLEKFLLYPPINRHLVTEYEPGLCSHVLISKIESIPLKYFEATSTDHISEHMIFSIDQHRDTYWSSVGSVSEDSVDILEYRIAMYIGVIYEVRLNFFEATWLQMTHEYEGYQCFSPKEIKIVIQTEELTYISPKYDVKHNNLEQSFQLEVPVFVTNRSKIQLYLIGKREKQVIDGLYYVCVNNFGLIGVSGINVPYLWDEECGVFKFSEEEMEQSIKYLVKKKMKLYQLSTFLVNGMVRSHDNLHSYIISLGLDGKK